MSLNSETRFANFFIVIIITFLLALLLITVIYAKAIHELKTIQTFVKTEIETAFEAKELEKGNLTDEEQQNIEIDAKRRSKRRLFLSLKFDQELKYLALRHLDVEYALANNNCAHVLKTQAHQSCMADVLKELRESRGEFEELLERENP